MPTGQTGPVPFGAQDFIVEHRINDKHDLEVGYITCTPWKLYFDGSVCDDGQEFGAVLISPNGAVFEF